MCYFEYFMRALFYNYWDIFKIYFTPPNIQKLVENFLKQFDFNCMYKVDNCCVEFLVSKVCVSTILNLLDPHLYHKFIYRKWTPLKETEAGSNDRIGVAGMWVSVDLFTQLRIIILCIRSLAALGTLGLMIRINNLIAGKTFVSLDAEYADLAQWSLDLAWQGQKKSLFVSFKNQKAAISFALGTFWSHSSEGHRIHAAQHQWPLEGLKGPKLEI